MLIAPRKSSVSGGTKHDRYGVIRYVFSYNTVWKYLTKIFDLVKTQKLG